MGTNIMANQVTTPIQNYFEKVLYENLTFEIPPLFFQSSRGIKKIVTSPCDLPTENPLVGYFLNISLEETVYITRSAVPNSQNILKS